MIEDAFTIEPYADLLTICREWSPADLLSVVRNECERISRMPGGQSAIRLGKGSCKVLMEEIYPLALFAVFKYGDAVNVRVWPVLGNQQHDAIITADDEQIQLEITQAHEGEAEFLRRLHLDERGHAPATGRVRKQGTKHRGMRINIDRAATTESLQVEAQTRLIRQALERKCKKPYPPSTQLLVMFEDQLTATAPQLMPTLETLRNVCRPCPFQTIHIFGWSRSTYVELREVDAER